MTEYCGCGVHRVEPYAHGSDDQTHRSNLPAVILWNALDYLINCELKKHFILVVQVETVLRDAHHYPMPTGQRDGREGDLSRSESVMFSRSDSSLSGSGLRFMRLETGRRCDDLSMIVRSGLASESDQRYSSLSRF